MPFFVLLFFRINCAVFYKLRASLSRAQERIICRVRNSTRDHCINRKDTCYIIIKHSEVTLVFVQASFSNLSLLTAWVVGQHLNKLPFCLGASSLAHSPASITRWQMGTAYGLQGSVSNSIQMHCIPCDAAPELQKPVAKVKAKAKPQRRPTPHPRAKARPTPRAVVAPHVYPTPKAAPPGKAAAAYMTHSMPRIKHIKNFAETESDSRKKEALLEREINHEEVIERQATQKELSASQIAAKQDLLIEKTIANEKAAVSQTAKWNHPIQKYIDTSLAKQEAGVMHKIKQEEIVTITSAESEKQTAMDIAASKEKALIAEPIGPAGFAMPPNLNSHTGSASKDDDKF